MKLEFSQQIFKNNQISYFMKICPMEAEFLHADGWADGRMNMMKLIVSPCNFENVPKKIIMHFHRCEEVHFAISQKSPLI